MTTINENKVISEVNRIAQIQRNNGMGVDMVAICNVVAAMLGYRFKDVLAVMDNTKENKA